MSKTRSIQVVALSTVFSRLTGFLRDMFVYATFGTGALNSAFIIAFTIPNLFRRFMGEGALTSAFMPMMAESQAKEGKAAAFGFLNKVLSYSAVILLITTLVGVCGFSLLHLLPLEERWHLSANLGVWVFPFLIFVCLSAIICGALNLQKKFATAALAQIWVNLSMTLALAIAVVFISDAPMTRMYWLCGGVLLGGFLQLALPSLALMKEGWRPNFGLQKDERLKTLYGLFTPGLLGATVAQTNTVISQLLAFGLDDAAVSVLFLASRLMQLPLGVFAAAVTTVTFPIISQKAAEGDKPGFHAAYNHGASLIHSVMIPAGLGLAILSEPLLTALFKWGSFDAQSVAQTAPILAIYALGLPFYASCTIVTRAFHSLKDTLTPARWSFVALITNLAFSLLLRELFQTLGLVIANVLSTAIFALGLRWEFAKKEGHKFTLSKDIISICAAGAFMTIAAGLVIVAIPSGEKLYSWLKIALGASIGLGVYLVALWRLSPENFRGLISLLRRNAPKQAQN